MPFDAQSLVSGWVSAAKAQVAAAQTAPPSNDPHNEGQQYALAKAAHGGDWIEFHQLTIFENVTHVCTVGMFPDGTYWFWDYGSGADAGGSGPSNAGGGPCQWSDYAKYKVGDTSNATADKYGHNHFPAENMGGITLQQAIVYLNWFEPKMSDGREMLGWRHPSAGAWWQTPPGFPSPPPSCFWRSWSRPGQGTYMQDPDWFVIWIPGATPDQRWNPSTALSLKVQAAVQVANDGSNASGDLALASGCPIPPPAQYWSPKQLGEGTSSQRPTCWHTDNSRIGLTESRNQLGISCRSAPPNAHWFADSSPDNPDHAGDHELFWDGPIGGPVPPAPNLTSGDGLPSSHYEPIGPGGYKYGSASKLSDAGRYWEPIKQGDCIVLGYRTQQAQYDFGKEALHILGEVGQVAGTVLAPVLVLTGVGAPLAALIVGGEVALAAAASRQPYGPGKPYQVPGCGGGAGLQPPQGPPAPPPPSVPPSAINPLLLLAVGGAAILLL